MQILVEIIKMQHVLWLNIHALCDITAQSTNTRAPRVTLFTLNLCINAIQGMEISKASINSWARDKGDKESSLSPLSPLNNFECFSFHSLSVALIQQQPSLSLSLISRLKHNAG